ncbi:MAG: aldehyde dehydrogenase family protein [Oceanospirillales bacterium]|uniref:Acyl-CoA reductase-like NAD-dependent aldehyde dehydrogenase n=1 Tax=Marinobacterium halophilum TaxID=267374 RepID=A0A2P8EQH3_9GAMM|nr:aldehyde dehydrogenase family protein [Marinobacterium halophilum]MBR9829960.1 aldehyde dehydrogenase family protein [Oceanospirillales bacterium]PSL11694.1 acyl-CoA reductase-like NAD-dependent aldehyde dehydrogenase [Marinobacterium halophilum]
MQTVSTLYINGQAVAGDRDAFPVINPATGDAFAHCPAASPEQVDDAVAAAGAAFKTFQYTPNAELKAMLHRIADLIDAHADELAQLVTLEQGKPLALAQMEVGAAAGWTRYTADLEIPVKVIEDSETRLAELHYKPLGVVGSITPWNWPLMIAVWHIMPALRTGNTVVSKPSSFTPFSTLKLVELINEVVPAGVINIVTGEGGIGRAMTQHADIRKIVFTGSTPTGQDIMRNAADNLKRLTLELGGNDAGIVLPGADLDRIAPALFQTAFINMGQTCAALKRLYVHESQYEDLCQRLAKIATEQVVGNGLEVDVTFGPVQNKAQLAIVAELVSDAKQQGARVLSGGDVQSGNGYFYPPTIVADVSNGVRLVDEEQFGPALPVVRYSDIDEAVAMANDNVNGLGASVWGEDVEQARSVAVRLESGTAWINNHSEVLPHCPFGGSKMSGIGVEFGEEGLLEYTQSQLLNISRG